MASINPLTWYKRYKLKNEKELESLSDDRPTNPSFGPNVASDHPLMKGGDDDYDIDEAESLEYRLPKSRFAQYPLYDLMMEDSVIDSAIDHHLSNALAPRTDTGQILTIKAKSEKNKKLVEEISADLQRMINQNIRSWMFGSVKNGVSYILPYVRKGEGLIKVRHDFYTRPDMIVEYEQGGSLIGYLHKTDMEYARKGKIKLIEPWRFLSFKMPQTNTEIDQEPMWKDKYSLDIASGEPEDENPIESQNYGRSLLASAYGPYMNLRKAIMSLNAARHNAGRKERFIQVETGGVGAAVAARFYSTILKLFAGKKRKATKRSQKGKASSLVENTIIPSGGNLNITSETHDVNIAHIEDIRFHVSKLAGALSVDKSLLGFTEDLSGGLGEGGFFQASLGAATKANTIRTVATETLNELIELHVFWKYGKVFINEELPWDIEFHSIATAIEKEEQQAKVERVNQATSEVGVIQMVDPNFEHIDKGSFVRRLMTRSLGYTDEEYEEVKAKKPVATDAENPPKKPPVFDSSSAIEQQVYKTITDILG